MNLASSIDKNELSKLPVFDASRKANMYIILQNHHKFYLKELEFTINFLIKFSSALPSSRCSIALFNNNEHYIENPNQLLHYAWSLKFLGIVILYIHNNKYFILPIYKYIQ